ncbi:MAG: CDP-alcohol phosphatidyltransferase family protein [Bacteroidales bacterium]|nr:CDP-alcohol phosphatidyltransferase family protein [Bacteroidales bacterium]
METKQATRIQTSVLHNAEKKALTWLAVRQPEWVTSDTMTFIGILGAIVIATGYILTNVNINFLWLASLGFVINWYGDSLDGTLARIRNKQRPTYGFYIDHTVDCLNECLMCIGIGLSAFMHFPIAMIVLVLYLLLTINVLMNTYLKQEFKLDIAKIGPTELRLIVIIANTIMVLVKPLRDYSLPVALQGKVVELTTLDLIGIGIIVIMLVMLVVTMYRDAKYYAKIDPKP